MDTVRQVLRNRVFPAFLSLLAAAAGGMAVEPPRVAAPKLVAALRPLADNHTIAGAVVLAASPDKVLAWRPSVMPTSRPSGRCGPIACSGSLPNPNPSPPPR